jgi:hypothetical protein
MFTALDCVFLACRSVKVVEIVFCIKLIMRLCTSVNLLSKICVMLVISYLENTANLEICFSGVGCS